MTARDDDDRGSLPAHFDRLASPFLEDELFADETDAESEAHLSILDAESPFQPAFTRRRGRVVRPEAYRRVGDAEFEGLEDGAPEYFLEPDEEFEDPARELMEHDTPTPARPGTYRGGKLAEFAATTPVRIGVFVPQAASTADEVDVVVFIHGHLWVCEPAPKTPQGPIDLITREVFTLGRIVDESQRAIVLAVPFLDWRKRDQPPLGDPAKLNQLVAEVLIEAGRMRSTPAPALRTLILAGHSRAHSILNPLAKAHASPEMTRGALGKLAAVWKFDTTYSSSPTSAYRAWSNAKPSVIFRVFYRAWTWNKQRERVPADSKAGGEKFAALARQLARKSPGRFHVTVVKESHCAVPRTRLPGLLAAASGAPKPSPELEFEDERESATEHRHEDGPEGEEEHWLDAEREDQAHWQEGQGDERGSWREEAEGKSPYTEVEDEHHLDGREVFEDEGFAAADDWSQAETEDHGPAEALEPETKSSWSHGSGTNSGWSAEGALFEGPEVALLDDYLQYLGELVDEEVFDDEVGSAEQEWQAHPAIHGHFNGNTPQQRFALYLQLRSLYQQATGANNPAKWITDKIVSLTFLGRRTPAHRDLRPSLAAAEAELQRRGARPALSSFWGFVPRKMRTRNRLSNHALGRAVDIDPKTNPHIYSKDEILVIREATGVDLGKPQAHNAMRSASQAFRQTFNSEWMIQQTKTVQDAARRSRTALDRYARDGFLNLEQALIDALIGAGFTWGGNWKSEKDFMHFELPMGRQPGPAAGSGATRPAMAAAGVAAARVRFAQRVLNAAEGEKLKVDADLGPRTRTALERFRRKYSLGTGGVVDEKTVLALAQRALEELRQQSMFGAPGVLDAATQGELVAFKSARGLAANATLDAATLEALGEAMVRRTGAASTPAPAATSPTAPPPTATPGSLPKLGAGLKPPADTGRYRKFRLTTYYVVDQQDHPTGRGRVPIFNLTQQKIAESSPEFFGKLSLEGSGRLADGRLINVTGKRVPVSHDAYASVLAYHRRAYAKRDEKLRKEGRAPVPTTYSGIVVRNDRVVEALAFDEVPANRRGIGFGTQRGLPYVPFRTLAADIGHTKYAKVDPRWRGKGGLVPPLTHVYIKEYAGLQLPDGTTHDGWFIVNDTGGGIFGAHFDVFVGTQALRKQVELPEFGQVWFASIEERIPPGYTYGLKA